MLSRQQLQGVAVFTGSVQQPNIQNVSQANLHSKPYYIHYHRRVELCSCAQCSPRAHSYKAKNIQQVHQSSICNQKKATLQRTTLHPIITQRERPTTTNTIINHSRFTNNKNNRKTPNPSNDRTHKSSSHNITSSQQHSQQDQRTPQRTINRYTLTITRNNSSKQLRSNPRPRRQPSRQSIQSNSTHLQISNNTLQEQNTTGQIHQGTCRSTTNMPQRRLWRSNISSQHRHFNQNSNHKHFTTRNNPSTPLQQNHKRNFPSAKQRSQLRTRNTCKGAHRRQPTQKRSRPTTTNHTKRNTNQAPRQATKTTNLLSQQQKINKVPTTCNQRQEQASLHHQDSTRLCHTNHKSTLKVQNIKLPCNTNRPLHLRHQAKPMGKGARWPGFRGAR